MTDQDKTPPADRKQVQGEGDYEASRRFDADEKAFVDKNRAAIPGLAKDAEDALEGADGDELRQAEEEGKSHARK